LGRLGWKETDLASRPKTDPAKLALAARLRKETTLSIKAIAARAHLGTSKSAKRTVARMDEAGCTSGVSENPTRNMKENEPCYWLTPVLLLNVNDV
jgi:hypothetical protein